MCNLLSVLSPILLFGKLNVELDNVCLGVLLGRHYANDARFDGIKSRLAIGGMARLCNFGGLDQYVCDKPTIV